ncbi:MAG TPA: hypothetical protein VHZ06_01100 [Marmoricola sp.]|jgi:hypothetical protein|nr:hypothetical protein [Marmoricola sp.]
MSKRRIAAGASLLAAVLAGGLAAGQIPANADAAPQGNDVVGVGSDVEQIALNFLADGAPGGDLGYNSAGNKNRIFSFDATGDANGRRLGTDPALGTSAALNSTVVLRAGTSPVQRPNGGSAGLAALLADGTNDEISFVRTPNLPTSTQQGSAKASIASGGLGTPLHAVEIATDTDYIATATTTNAPSSLSGKDLVNIYNGTWTTWGQVPHYSDTHTTAQDNAAIIPLIPQTGAGMRTVFLNGLSSFTSDGKALSIIGTNVKQVQQNDPTAITGLSAADQANAIVPFPQSRLSQLTNGYFHTPDTAYPGGAALSAAGISVIKTGTAPSDGTAAWKIVFPYYIVFRQSDLDSNSTPWQPGGTLNWVKTLFSDPDGPAPYVNTAPAQKLLTDSGVTPLYNDLGVPNNS